MPNAVLKNTIKAVIQSDIKGDIKSSIAFYAPLKSPHHAVPSGDRKIARLFMAALEHAGFSVELASQLRSFDKTGNALRQQRMLALAEKEAARILRRWRKQKFKPAAWFSYHLYYKAPDLIGPIICKQLNIPYIVAEASWAAKRANGPWSLYHQQVDVALQLASKVICINPIDKVALTGFYRNRRTDPIQYLPIFIDDVNSQLQPLNRQQVAQRYDLDSAKPWLITIAMMRSGDKFHSYQLLAEVAAKISQTHQLLVIGDGVMRNDVELLFSESSQVKFAGALDNDAIFAILAQFELLIWPAVNEALGMIFLEAQQSGVAIIAGEQGGITSVVDADMATRAVTFAVKKTVGSARLFTVNDSAGMALAVDDLLTNSELLTSMQKRAKKYISQQHSLTASANKLKNIIEELL